jgi:hypothetical protein
MLHVSRSFSYHFQSKISLWINEKELLSFLRTAPLEKFLSPMSLIDFGDLLTIADE